MTKGKIWMGHPPQINETFFFKLSSIIKNSQKAKLKLPGYPYDISTAG